MEGATFYVRDMEEWDPLTEIAVLLESLVKIVRHVVLLGKATALVNFFFFRAHLRSIVPSLGHSCELPPFLLARIYENRWPLACLPMRA